MIRIWILEVSILISWQSWIADISNWHAITWLAMKFLSRIDGSRFSLNDRVEVVEVLVWTLSDHISGSKPIYHVLQ